MKRHVYKNKNCTFMRTAKNKVLVIINNKQEARFHLTESGKWIIFYSGSIHGFTSEESFEINEYLKDLNEGDTIYA